MFEENPFKQDIINTLIPEGATVTVYRCGDLIDLCRGPHVPTTGVIKNYKIMKQVSKRAAGKRGGVLPIGLGG